MNKTTSVLEKPIPRGRTKKERMAILMRVMAEVNADPALKAAVKRFIRATTSR